jgi:hypothetical protein
VKRFGVVATLTASTITSSQYSVSLISFFL